MNVGGVAIAVVVTAVAVCTPARSESLLDGMNGYFSPERGSTISLHLLSERHAHESRSISVEGTLPYPIAQQHISGELKDLIRLYNPDLRRSQVREIARWTETYSQQYGIDPRLIAGLVARESGFDPRATSRTGARGLGQISASLGKDLGIRDRYDIQENLEGTTRWIRTLYDTWRADGVAESQAIHWSLASYRQGLTRTREVGIPEDVAKYINEVYEIAGGLSGPVAQDAS